MNERRRIRVLVVDGSPSFGWGLKELLESDPEIAVVGVAGDGQEAVRMTAALTPDLIATDVHLRKLGGLETIESIMAERPTPILVLTADRMWDGRDIHCEALARGALDLMPKPLRLPATEEERRTITRQVKLLSTVKVVRHVAGSRKAPSRADPRAPAPSTPLASPQPRTPPPQAAVVPPRSPGRPEVVGIVASTGGPSALHRILRALPAGFPACLLIVQHISDRFVTELSRWLDSQSELDVGEASARSEIRQGAAWIAPAGKHMRVDRARRLVFDDSPPVEGHRPSGTVLLASIAEVYGRKGAGVVLTGMGRDGVAGLLQIHRQGGPTIAQDEKSSVVYGMPKAAVEAGAVGRVVPLSEIPAVLGGITDCPPLPLRDEEGGA